MSVALESTEKLYPFVLTEEQEHLRREIREFAAREIAPNVMAWDEASEFPLAVVKKLGEMGLLGVIFPAEYGGAGLGYVDYVLAIEELARCRRLAWHHRRRSQFSRNKPHLPRWKRSTKAEVCFTPGYRRVACRVGIDRARRRL